MNVDTAFHEIVRVIRKDQKSKKQCTKYLAQGSALDENVFLTWLDEHKGNGEWLKETSSILARMPLHHALGGEGIPAAVSLALLAACPEAAKLKARDGETPLHLALCNTDTTEPVVSALFAAYPEAVNVKDEWGKTPLDYVILPGIPADVVAEYRRNLPDDGAVFRSYLREGKHLDAATFLVWFDAHKSDGEWLNTTDEAGNTPLHHALRNEGTPAAVALALLAACPEATKVVDNSGYTPLHAALQNKTISAAVQLASIAACLEAAKVKTEWGYGSTPLGLAVYLNASAPVVAALIAVWPGAIKEVDGDGDTPLHYLAIAERDTLAECRHTNIICFMLVKHRASLAATNAEGQTPTATAAAAATAAAIAAASATPNNHLIATLREITLFKKHAHLSWMHFRDWTTISHAWCTPSAKLVAVTVLMVGETYKRGLLPRLPMDCWYRILNKLPRHELRLGGCEPVAEQAALAIYATILQEARVAVDASDAAAAAARA